MPVTSLENNLNQLLHLLDYSMQQPLKKTFARNLACLHGLLLETVAVREPAGSEKCSDSTLLP